jgi:hypothetical protein
LSLVARQGRRVNLPIIRPDIAAQVRRQARAEAAGGERPVVLVVRFGWAGLRPAQPGGAARHPA